MGADPRLGEEPSQSLDGLRTGSSGTFVASPNRTGSHTASRDVTLDPQRRLRTQGDKARYGTSSEDLFHRIAPPGRPWTYMLMVFYRLVMLPSHR